MIIFDLDGTLADCEHRRHFVQAPEDECGLCHDFLMDKHPEKDFNHTCICGRQPGLWKPNWKKFFEDCDKDAPISSTIRILWKLNCFKEKIAIWSGRCESVREKTEKWLIDNVFSGNFIMLETIELKMRPIGDSTPDDQLKERWLDEAISQGETIDFVFDDRPKVVRMWRRRGIFVFDCNQTGQEF